MTTLLIVLTAWIGFCIAVLVAFVAAMVIGPWLDRFLSGEPSPESTWREFAAAHDWEARV